MPSALALSALLPASSPTKTAVVFLLTVPATLRAEAFERGRGLLAGHRCQRAGDDVGLAGQRSGAARRLPARTRRLPCGAHRRGACRAAAWLLGASSQLRNDSASTGPISFVDCSCSGAPRRAHRPSRTPWPAPGRRARRCGECPVHTTGATARSSCCARLLDDFGRVLLAEAALDALPSPRTEVLVRLAICSAVSCRCRRSRERARYRLAA